jgi:hypothetical protein
MFPQPNKQQQEQQEGGTFSGCAESVGNFQPLPQQKHILQVALNMNIVSASQYKVLNAVVKSAVVSGVPKLFGWGEAVHAGHGHGIHDTFKQPTEVTAGELGEALNRGLQVKQISCGWGRISCPLNDGSIYEWGCLDDS